MLCVWPSALGHAPLGVVTGVLLISMPLHTDCFMMAFMYNSKSVRTL